MASDLVGAVGQPYEMRVELGKIREFARATRSSNPAFLEAEDAVSPPTFLMSSAHWSGPDGSAWKKLGLDSTRTVHGEQEFTFHGPPPRAGARLIAQERIDKDYTKDGKRGGTMRFVEAVTEYRDEAGSLVAEARMTLIETGQPLSEG